MKRMLVRAAAGFAVLFVVVAAPARAELYGLSVGIDDYRHIAKLRGAVNDARDVADALRTAGATDVRVLLDREATREEILRNWKELVARAAPGSTLVFSYAGHGGQEPERVPGSEQDGLDEVLLLAGFDTRGSGTAERIVDDELNAMLDEASHLRVVFVADACHSGTMTRSVDLRAGRISVRNATYGAIEDDELPPPPPEAARITEGDLVHVTFFAAVRENELAPEIVIDGRPRGALSWAFAQGLRGRADEDGDGVLSKGEIERFVRENVRMKLEGRQHPQVQPAGRGEQTMLPAPALRLAVLNADGLDAAELLGRLRNVLPVDASTPVRTLTWDVAAGEVLNAVGDVVALVDRPRGGSVDTAAVQGVIDKMQVLQALGRIGETRSLEMSLEPGDRRHAAGERVAISIDGMRFAYFTLLNLAADGTVNFLYPLDDGTIADPPDVPKDRPFSLELAVQPPFGADHFVAIASAEPVPELHRALAALEGSRAAPEVGRLLSLHLRDGAYQLGLHGVFTGEQAP